MSNGRRQRRREGRADLLELRGTIGGEDLTLDSLAAGVGGGPIGLDDMGDPCHLVPRAPGGRRGADDPLDDFAPLSDRDNDDGLSVQLALPSFDDEAGGISGSSSLTSLLTRPSPISSRLSWDVSSARAPSLPRSEAQARVASPGNLPALRKTGTTIVGVLCDSGRTVVIGADTRATDGTVVADKRCEKVHRLADNVWCCGAGTSGDIDALVRRVKYTFLLRGMVAGSIGNVPTEFPYGEGDDDDDEEWGAESSIEGEQGRRRLPAASVSAVCRYIRDLLYEGGGSIGANLVLGGYDPTAGRAVLTAIHPHGSMDVIPYTALGSGGLAATAVLESRYPAGGIERVGSGDAATLSVEMAIDLVRDAVGAGIAHDLGSGSQVDLCIIGPGGTTYRRAVVPEEELPRGAKREEGVVMTADEGVGEGESGDEDVIMNGVNGFGSLPYFVKSKRVLMEGAEIVRESQRTSLEALLDLENDQGIKSEER